jgi:hypothetical protein
MHSGRNLDTLATVDQATGPAPNVNMMRLIHGRAPDGYIALERKLPDGSDWDRRHRCFLPVKDLNEMFPAVVEHFARDGYQGIAVYYGAAKWTDKETGLPAMALKERRLKDGRTIPQHTMARCKENLRWLPACFTDLDCGRSKEEAERKGRPELALSWRYAAAAAGEMMDNGELPQATIIARSGRGLYLLWLLCDAQDRRLPVRTLPKSNVALMEACNKELNRRLLHLAADKGTFDATRLCRIDGSWHSGAQRRVTYLEQLPPDIPLGYIQRDEHGRRYVYTLAEMAAALNIPTSPAALSDGTQALLEPSRKWERKRGPTKNPGSKPEMAKFTMRLHAKRVDDIIALEQYRVRQTGKGYAQKGTRYPADPTNGWQDGFIAALCGRCLVLTLYAEALRGSGTAEAETLGKVRTMAANCNPPWPDKSGESAEALVSGVYSKWTKTGKPLIPNRTNDTLCKWLGITAALAEELHLESIIPPDLKARRKAETPTRDQYTAMRRAAILELVARDGDRFLDLPPRRMAHYLAAHDLPGSRNPVNHKGWSHEQIRDDLDALNLARRRRRGRPSTWPATVTA